MPRVFSVSMKIAEVLRKQLEKFDERAANGEIGKEDLDRLEQLARINKLNTVAVRGVVKAEAPEAEEVDTEELEKELRKVAKAQNPDFFSKRGPKPGPREPIAPPPPKICEAIHRDAGWVCDLLADHQGDHFDHSADGQIRCWADALSVK